MWCFARCSEPGWSLTGARPRSRVAESDAARRAQIVQHALFAARPARVAHTAAVPDQEVRKEPPLLARQQPLEVALDLDRVVVARQAEPLREPPHVCVDDDPLGV